MAQPLTYPLTRGADRPTRCYLAGAIEHAPDGGEAWRRELTPFLRDEMGWEVYDPTTQEAAWLSDDEQIHFREWKASDLPRFQLAMRKVIAKDLEVLDHSDIVICLWDEHVYHGGGTHGELTLAHIWQIPVHLVLGMPQQRVSSWILGCATHVHESFDALREHLRQTQLVRE